MGIGREECVHDKRQQFATSGIISPKLLDTREHMAWLHPTRGMLCVYCVWWQWL